MSTNDEPPSTTDTLRDTLRDLAGFGGGLSPSSDAEARAARRAARGPAAFGGAPPGRTPAERGRAVRRVIGFIAGLVVIAFLLPSAVTYINPGHVGIVIHRAGGGVDRTPLGPGLHPVNPLFT